MNKYELALILKPDIKSENIEKLKKEIEDLVKKNKGKLWEVEDWGLRKLSYPIKSREEGYYLFIPFEAETKAIEILKKKLSLSEFILRLTFLKIDRKKDKKEV